MSIRTVRLDAETERALRDIQRATGMPISAALKRGLRVVRDEVVRPSRQTPYDIYAQLDLGTGGYARQIFTVDRRDFTAYRIRRGHRYYPVEIMP